MFTIVGKKTRRKKRELPHGLSLSYTEYEETGALFILPALAIKTTETYMQSALEQKRKKTIYILFLVKKINYILIFSDYNGFQPLITAIGLNLIAFLLIPAA